MAARFWVGGTGTWDNATTTHWAATSGGAGGQSVPGSADDVTFDAASGGGTVTLNYVPSVVSITGGAHTGTFDTGNNNINLTGDFSWTGTSTRTLTLGTSTITGTASSWVMTVTTGLTFSGTSAILSMKGHNKSFIGGSLTYGTVTINGDGGGAFGLRGNNTFTNLNITHSNSSIIGIDNDQIVTGTLTVAGTSATNYSGLYGTQSGGAVIKGTTRTITATTTSITDTCFSDIIGAGAAAWTGTNVGDMGGNSGITFDTPKTRYWVGTTGGTWFTLANWGTGSGTGSGASIPLPQDTVVFDSNSITSGSRTITCGWCNLPALDFTGLTNNPTITFTNTNANIFFSGSVKLISGITLAGTTTPQILNTSPATITSAGKTWGSSFTVNNTSTVTLADTFTLSSANTLLLTSGTFDANNFNVTCGIFSSSNSNARTLTMGSGTWTLTGNNATIWTTDTQTGLTINQGTSTIVANYSGGTGTRTIITGVTASNSQSLNNISITAGTDSIFIRNNTTCFINSVDFTGFAGTLASTTNSGLFLKGNLTLGSGMTVTASTSRTFSFKGTSGTQTFASNGVTFGYNILMDGVGGTLSLGDAPTLVAGTLLTLTNGTFNANNQNLSIPAFSSSNSNTRVITMGSGTWTLTGTGTVWTTATSTGLTLTPSSSTIVINDTSATSKTFAGGGLTYANITASGDNVIIVGNNRFNQVNNNTAGLTNGLIFTAGSNTTLLGALGLTTNGSTNSLARLTSSSAGSPATLSKDSGIVQVSFMYIQDSTATGGATFNAYGSLNISGNTGWNFLGGGFRTDNTAARLKVSTSKLKVSTARLVATVDRLESPFN